MLLEPDLIVNAFHEVLEDRSIVKDEALIQRYRRNVTALDRVIPIVLLPADEQEVFRIVSVANACSIPLYPISTGKNWGLGSKLPVLDRCVVVDLSRLNRIHHVDETSLYAIIEPGVTQAQLAEHLQLHHPALSFNITGTFAHTSIVGNVLERGDGAYARVHDLLGVKGVLGNGERFAVGGIWNTDPPLHHSRYVAGPDLVGLYNQSNFGIVTQMAFSLLQQCERRYLFWGQVQDDRLEKVVSTLNYFSRQRVINAGSINIGYANRFLQAGKTFKPHKSISQTEEEWNFYVLLEGTRPVADTLAREFSEALTPLCLGCGAFLVGGEHNPYDTLPLFAHPLIKPLLGVPDNQSIETIFRITGTDLPACAESMDVDDTPFGMKCCIFVIPLTGENVRRVASSVAKVRGLYGLNIKPSFFGDGRTLITIHFRSDSHDHIKNAELSELDIWNDLASLGFPPYRVSIDQMDRLRSLQPAFFNLVAQLKAVLDPKDIIAPGRYCPSIRLSK